jgi:hypothetical protein
MKLKIANDVDVAYMQLKYCSLIWQIDKVDFRWFWVISSIEQL